MTEVLLVRQRSKYSFMQVYNNINAVQKKNLNMQ